MRRILAIAAISMRTAFRSKVFLTLLGMLILVIVGIPLTIKGDGTMSGHVRILIEYTLNFVRFILAVAAIWAGCASISQEVESKQIQMTATKPVRALHIWLGKWLGIVAPISLLTLLAGAVVYGMLVFNPGHDPLGAEERHELRRDLLVGRIRIAPEEPEGLSERVDKAAADVLEHGEIPPNLSERDLRESLRRSFIVRRQTIDPGGECDWYFELPSLPDGHPAILECKLSSSVLGGVSIPARLKIGDGAGNMLDERDLEFSSEIGNRIELSADLFADREGVSISCENLSDEYTAIFPDRDSIALLAYAGGFESNYLRALIIMIVQLALLTAVAVTMGAVFSTPVAAFISIFMLLLVFMDGYIQEMAGKRDYSGGGHSHGQRHRQEQAEGPGLIDHTTHYVFVAVDFAVAPLRQPDPLGMCSGGLYIPWRMLGEVMLYQLIIYSGGFALLGSSIFKRRELALPQR